MNYAIFEEVILLLTLAVLAIAVLKRFNIAPILAYLIVGIIVSPYSLGLISDNRDVRFIAEFGVVLLMFTVGLEFSTAKFLALKKQVLGLGGAQVLITSLIAGSINWFFSHDLKEAITIGGIIALSSTALVIKQLSEQLELNSKHGHLAVSILIFQDIAVIPMLIMIVAFSSDAPFTFTVEVGSFIKAGLVLFLMLAMGHWILRPLLREIAKVRSTELFTLSVLLVSLSAAWATHEAGLSLALGGFIAGMMLSETEYRYQIEVEIRPFRDILLGLFFITVGMLLDIRSLLPLLPWVIVLTITLLLTKTLIITLLSLVFGATLDVAARTGLVLSQGGEFGFALLTLALTSDIISDTTAQVVLSSLILSMMISPWFIKNNGRWVEKIYHAPYIKNLNEIKVKIQKTSQELEDHVIICGYGRIGQNISRFIEEESQPYIALDLDVVRIQEAQNAGEMAFYGDAAQREILQAAGICKAKVVLITIKNNNMTLKIIHQIRRFTASVVILVLTKDETNLDELYKQGATEVIPQTMESSLIMASHLLSYLNVPLQEIMHMMVNVRQDHYKFLLGYFPGEKSKYEGRPEYRERMNTIILHRGYAAIGKTIGELDLDKRKIVFSALRRGGIRGQKPTKDVILKENDVLIMYARPEDLEYIKVELMSGH
jgi:CPA2 family monovalent cation:H+ antiporter-2